MQVSTKVTRLLSISEEFIQFKSICMTISTVLHTTKDGDSPEIIKLID